jgi:hypothetical protein
MLVNITNFGYVSLYGIPLTLSPTPIVYHLARYKSIGFWNKINFFYNKCLALLNMNSFSYSLIL